MKSNRSISTLLFICSLFLFISSGLLAQEIILNDPITTGAYCDQCNGSIMVELDQGNIEDTEYSIDGGLNWQESPFFNNLCEGDYLIIGRSQSNGINFATTTAQIGYAPDLKMLDFSYTCFENQNSVSANLLVTGGTADYHVIYYSPSGEQFTAGSGSENIKFDLIDLIDGDYFFYIEDRLGCIKDTVININYDCFIPGNQIPKDWGLKLTQLQEESLDIQLSDLIPEEQIALKILSPTGVKKYNTIIENQDSWNLHLNLEAGIYFISLESRAGKKSIHKIYIF